MIDGGYTWKNLKQKNVVVGFTGQINYIAFGYGFSKSYLKKNYGSDANGLIKYDKHKFFHIWHFLKREIRQAAKKWIIQNALQKKRWRTNICGCDKLQSDIFREWQLLYGIGVINSFCNGTCFCS